MKLITLSSVELKSLKNTLMDFAPGAYCACKRCGWVCYLASRARAFCACSRCRWGLFGIFSLIYLFSFLSPSLWETARYRLKYCLKGPLNPKQPTNQLPYHISLWKTARYRLKPASAAMHGPYMLARYGD